MGARAILNGHPHRPAGIGARGDIVPIDRRERRQGVVTKGEDCHTRVCGTAGRINGFAEIGRAGSRDNRGDINVTDIDAGVRRQLTNRIGAGREGVGDGRDGPHCRNDASPVVREFNPQGARGIARPGGRVIHRDGVASIINRKVPAVVID